MILLLFFVVSFPSKIPISTLVERQSFLTRGNLKEALLLSEKYFPIGVCSVHEKEPTLKLFFNAPMKSMCLSKARHSSRFEVVSQYCECLDETPSFSREKSAFNLTSHVFDAPLPPNKQVVWICTSKESLTYKFSFLDRTQSCFTLPFRSHTWIETQDCSC